MAQHKIDGVFLTRRGDEIAAAYQGGKGLGIMKMRSETINHVFRAAEAEGRVVSIMYDLAGMPSHQLEQWVLGDWEFMINQKHVLDSPAYVREHGRPVVALWGVGFKNASQDPQAVLNLIHRLSEMSGGAYVILGVPVTWQKQDNSWQTVYKMADAIAPLSVGALVDEESVNNWSKDVQQPAIHSLKSGSKRVDYVSVVWPGHEGQLMRNGLVTPSAPRRDGAFLWRQVYNAHRDGARLMYAEMFDGFDDGTALLPSIAATQSGTPSDWYLRICGYASEALKGEKHLYEDLPRKELAEYWSTRPQYEERQQEEPSGSSSGGGASASASGGPSASGSGGSASLAPPARAPTRSMTADFGDAPPPYSLEPETPTAASSGAAVFTAEPESVAPAPISSSSQTPYQSDRPTAPAVNRVDSTHSVASSSAHSQQHRPGRISVPDPSTNAIPVQPPSGYPGPGGYPGGMGVGSNPSSPPATNTPLQRVDSVPGPNAYGRPPQHPGVATRPPPVASTRPPARPQSSGHSSPPASYPTPPTPGSVHQLTDQMQGMNVGGPNRPAPEHVFAGIGLGTPQRPSMPGMPASPFEGINMPGRPGPGPGSFGPQPPLPPRHPGQFGPGHDAPPQTPSTPGSIPGSPFYPAPLQHGPGPVHQHTIGPTHQATLGPTHQHTIGPAHQGSTSPGHNYPSPAHQATLGPSQPGQPPRPGPPPQPGFQPSGPYVPHHQPTGPYTPQGAPQQGYFGPHRQDSGGYPSHSGGYQSPPPQQPGGYSTPQQPVGGWHSPQHPGGGYPPTGSAGHSPQPQPGPALHPGGGQGSHPGSAGHSPHMGGPPQPQGPYPGYGQYPPGGQHPGARPGMPGIQYVDSALGVVGKYAGEDTKKKLEASVTGALNAGTKLWGRFNK
ncbi:hypothetical protein FS749_009420 [Ceratobasidium sp. UAMH 11750]|nr:hypothetical protein FS749_009420 [Ceratobasidium sp. UAMH 11750]